MTLRWRMFWLGLALSAAGSAHAARVETLPPHALTAGQAARVLTVFSGQTIESFDAEIVGVLRSGRANGDMILARATSERVVKSGIAAGMSGSPVYVDGRLIGALASGWPFTREPLFGITPIGEMLDVLAHPTAGDDGGSAGPAGALAPSAARSYRELSWPGAAPAEEESGPPAHALRPVPIPLAGSGLPAAALDMARAAFAPLHMQVVPGGSGAGGTADSLRPGAAVAVDLMRGDLLLSAIGTVTWRDGDDVLIFGHPFFQSGAVRLPLSTAAITTVVASDLSSFKLGVTGREVGAALQDRRAAVAGRIGASARLLPLRVAVRRSGTPPQVFRFESIEDRSVAPLLVSIATFTSLLEAGGNAGNETMRWRLALHRSGAAPFVLEDVTAGDGPAAAVAQRVAQPLGFLFNNPFERLALDSLTIDVEVEPGRRLYTIEEARLAAPVVRPGETARVRVALERWRGPASTTELALAVPADLAPGRYELWVGGGHELSAFAAARRPARFSPGSLAEAWRRLAELEGADGIHAVLVANAPEWTGAGRDYPALPGSARALLRDAGAGREGAAWIATARAPAPGAVQGQHLLHLVVENHAP